jgi:hypothetical protein
MAVVQKSSRLSLETGKGALILPDHDHPMLASLFRLVITRGVGLLINCKVAWTMLFTRYWNTSPSVESNPVTS